MSEGKEEKIRGEILLSPPMVVEWKVSGFFSCSKELGYSFRSPTFQCLDGTWFLECYPNGESNTEPGWIDLHLSRERSLSVHTITYQLGIRREDGIEYISETDTSEYKKGINEWGLFSLIERASLLKDQTDEITIFCNIRVGPTKDATSQTVQSGATDVSTETSEEDFKTLKSEVEDEEASHISAGIDKLAQNLKKLFLSGKYHDTIIKVKDEEFRVHKLILVVRSPVFASMFRHGTIECSKGVVTIEDCDPNAFKEFLSYLYSGKLVNMSTGNVLDIYFIADKYEVEEVKAACVEFMINNISIDNFCDFISLGLRHDEKGLITSATDYFTKNVKNIVLTVKWQCFYKEYPAESNELYIKVITHLMPD